MAEDRLLPDDLARAFGRAVQQRRRQLQLSVESVADSIPLSRSYLRGIESASIAPPANVAIPLAVQLDWNSRSTAELLGVIAYLRFQASKGSKTKAENVADRIETLFDQLVLGRKIGAPLLELRTDKDGALTGAYLAKTDQVINGAMSRAGTEHNREGPKRHQLPWMFELPVVQMEQELHLVPIKVESTYLLSFVSDYKTRIIQVIAYLAYVPSGRDFEVSGYDFSLIYNKREASLRLIIAGEEWDADAVKKDLVEALDRLTLNSAPRSLKTKKQRLDFIGTRFSVERALEHRKFLFNESTNCLEDPASPTAGEATSFRNAWIYEVDSGGRSAWVGFVDNYPHAQWKGAPLSLRDAEWLAGLFQ